MKDAILEPLLSSLKLGTFVKNYNSFAKEAANSNKNYVDYLLALSTEEVNKRLDNRTKKLIANAKFPSIKPLVEYDFPQVPSLNKSKLIALSNCDWIGQANNVCLMGQTGLGKTHLAIALGIEACKKKFSVRFIQAATLANDLSEAKDALSLSKYQRKLNRFSLIILDEVGYLPLSKQDAELLFQFFSDRYEKGSILVTTNLEFSDWTKFMIDPTMTSALLDRFTHHCHIFNLVGESFRFKQQKAIREKERN